ncbi:MAG: hypothetical protein ACOYBY_13980 [Dermatophilaceae bacterium]
MPPGPTRITSAGSRVEHGQAQGFQVPRVYAGLVGDHAACTIDAQQGLVGALLGASAATA